MNVHIAGVGLWAPGIPSASAYLSGQRDDSKKPAVDIVASRMKRATSIMTRTAVEVVTQAARDAQWELDSFATVFGSAHGEIQIAAEQMVMMQEGSGVVSPARFKNSVHNTAAGLFSIAAKNKGFTTAIAAGLHTFPMALFEAWCLLASEEQSRVVVSICEETLPMPIVGFSDHQAMGVAFALSRDAAGSRATLGPLHHGEGSAHAEVGYEGHTAEGALRIVRAMQDGYGGDLALSSEWTVRVDAAKA